MEQKNIGIYLNDWFHYFLMAFLFIGTYFYIPVPQSLPLVEAVMFGYSIQELFFRYGTLFLFGISSLMHPKRRFTDKYFIVFCVFVLVDALVKGFGIEARRAVLNIFFGFVFYKTVVEHFDFYKLKQFGWLFFSLISLNLLFCGFQYLGIDPLFSSAETIKAGWQDALVGLMKNKVHIGVLAAILAPIAMYASPWLIIPFIPVLVISQSSASAVALAVGLGMIAYVKFNKKIFISVASILLILGFIYVVKFDMPHGQFGERFKVWKATTTMALKQDPYFGQGIGSFAKINMATMQTNGSPQNWVWTHNEYLQLFYETGFAGVLIIVLFIIGNIKTLFKHKLKVIHEDYIFLVASFIIVCMVSVLQFPFHLGRFAGVLVFVMALLAARREDLNYS